jgi:hypothetical protein
VYIWHHPSSLIFISPCFSDLHTQVLLCTSGTISCT